MDRSEKVTDSNKSVDRNRPQTDKKGISRDQAKATLRQNETKQIESNVVADIIQKLPIHLRFPGKFFYRCAKLLSWGDLSNDVVMDIGCGTDSLDLFATLFPKFHKVIAIDINARYIVYATKHKFDLRMEYHVADITNRSTLIQWRDQVPKIVSSYCLNCLTGKKDALENIHYMLEPGGEAVIVAGLRNPNYEAAKLILSKPKWKTYQYVQEEFPEHEMDGKGIKFYEESLKELDFEIILLEEDFKVIPFPTEDAFKNSELTQDKIVMKNLPKNLHAEFQSEYMQTLMGLNDRISSEHVCLITGTVRIMIQKKHTS